MAQLDLPYLWAAQGRHGRLYWFYRRGKHRIPITSSDGRRLSRGEFGFMEAYERIHESFAADAAKGDGKFPIGSLGHAITEYPRSPVFDQLAPASQRAYNVQYNWLLTVSDGGKGHGHRPLAGMTQEIVIKLQTERYNVPDELRDEREPTPGAANGLLDALASLITFVKTQPRLFRLPPRWQSPTSGVKKLKGGDGHRPWEEDEIDAFRDKFNSIELERALLETLLNTGQRGSDVRVMTRERYRRGEIRVRQVKTGEYVWIPASDDLKAVLDPWLKSHGAKVFFPTATGKPIGTSRMGQVMRDAIHAAKLPDDCTPHGLRVTFATRLIELGADYQTIEAIVGHRTMAMAIKYTEKRRLARLGIGMLNAGVAARRAGQDMPRVPRGERSENRQRSG